MKLFEWVEAVTEPASRLMNERDCYLAAAIGCIQAFHSGTTTVLDYMYPMPSPVMYRRFSEAFKDAGMRGILGWGFQECGEEFGLPKTLTRPVGEVLNDFDKYGPEMTGSTLSPALAPGVVFGITPDGFRHIRDLSEKRNLLLTLHLNETSLDNEAVYQVHGKSAVRYLEDLGILGPNLLAVHCVKMTAEEIALFRDYNVKVSHNPSSNMYLGAGIAPVIYMRSGNIVVGLATDGGGSNSNDMLEVLEDTAFLQKVSQEDPACITAQDVLDMATLGGAEAIGRLKDLGSLQSGKKADLFVFDPLSPRSVPVLDPVASLVFSSGPPNIVLTMVDGKIVMEDREVKTIEEKALLMEAQSAAEELAMKTGTEKYFKGGE